jgi:hypothetical protein
MRITALDFATIGSLAALLTACEFVFPLDAVRSGTGGSGGGGVSGAAGVAGSMSGGGRSTGGVGGSDSGGVGGNGGAIGGQGGGGNRFRGGPCVVAPDQSTAVRIFARSDWDIYQTTVAPADPAVWTAVSGVTVVW